ncbi:hypothetical protein Tco_1258322, partial [Tanacetum coccineum]
MVYVVNGVLASGVDMVLEKKFVGFALQETELHPLMHLIRTLSMILQTFSPTLHNHSTNHTRVNYVEMTLIMIKDYRNERLDIHYRRECEIKIDELKGKFNGMSIEINKKKELRQLEQAANLSTYTTKPSRHFNSLYDDDYEESTIPLNEIVSQIPPFSPPVLPIEDPEDSLIMGDEDLSTIPKKESDEVIKSSVEDLVPIPSESEDTSGSDGECDLPSCNDFSPINVSEEKSVTFSNYLFGSNDDFTSSDDESLSDEDVPKDNVKIYSNPLFEFDDEYIFSDVNSIFDEVL